jgi:hypothetical protein
MHTDITWKAAIFTLIGLFAIATVVMNSSAESRGVARSTVESRGVARSAPVSNPWNRDQNSANRINVL